MQRGSQLPSAARLQPRQLSLQRGSSPVLFFQLRQVLLPLALLPQLRISSLCFPQPVRSRRIQITFRLHDQIFGLFNAGANDPFRAVRDERLRHRFYNCVVSTLLLGDFNWVIIYLTQVLIAETIILQLI